MQPELRMRLQNNETGVLLVQHAVAGFAELHELDALELDDVATAVAEACKNVVWHAYDGAEGPLEVELYALDQTIHAVVRDEGIGIRPHVGEQRPHHVGIGMPLIHARTRRVIYTNRKSGGTEVRMEFDMPSLRALEAHLKDVTNQSPETAPDSVWIWLALPSLAAIVLPRVLRTYATANGFRAQAAAELAHLLGVLTERGAGEPVELTLDTHEGALELRTRAAATLKDSVEAFSSGELALEVRSDSDAQLVMRVRQRA